MDIVEKARELMYKQTQINRAPIAPTIEFLLSDKCLWTTGANYLVDGGKSI